MQSNDLSIGVFDSGVGGLTVLKELTDLLPGENFIYFADNKHLPLGSKSEEEILKHAEEAALFLAAKNIKLLVVACNTTSSVALKFLQSLLQIPVIGVIAPLIQKAAVLKKRKMAVLATSATVRTGVYFQELKKRLPRSLVFEKACPLLAPLIEKGLFSSMLLQETIKAYLRPLKKEKIDLLVLACTHYPLALPLFQNCLSRKVQIIDGALCCARQVKRQLQRKKMLSGVNQGRIEFFASGKTASFQKTAEKIFGKTIEKVLKKNNNFRCIQKSKGEA